MRRQIFVISAILLSTRGVSAVSVDAYLLLEWPGYRLLGSLRQASPVRAYLFNQEVRRFARSPRNGRALYIVGDPHFTPLGHQAAAELCSTRRRTCCDD